MYEWLLICGVWSLFTEINLTLQQLDTHRNVYFISRKQIFRYFVLTYSDRLKQITSYVDSYGSFNLDLPDSNNIILHQVSFVYLNQIGYFFRILSFRSIVSQFRWIKLCYIFRLANRLCSLWSRHGAFVLTGWSAWSATNSSRKSGTENTMPITTRAARRLSSSYSSLSWRWVDRVILVRNERGDTTYALCRSLWSSAVHERDW